jgi:DNA (cytosine-5)-methyltransferase 1
MDLVAGQGLPVTRVSDNDLLPTPTLGHIRNHDEPVKDYLQRRQDFIEGRTKGMPGASLGVAVRMEMLPTPKARDSQPEGYEAGLRRTSPQIGTWAQAVANGDERVVGDLLPTPAARDFKDGSEPHERDGVVQTDTVARAIFNSGEVELFPTPRASRGASTTETFDLLVEEEALLPTPLVDDSKNTGHNQTRIKTLASEVWETERTTNWGKFEPAIHRWEQTIGRPAPAPTKPDGKDGNHRLSSAFTEWMMGLPAGWITDAGLTRTEELKACGNGVVPQQAELALRILLEGVDL